MPIYEDENNTREKLFELRRENRCQVCSGKLDVFMDYDRGKAFLACGDWTRTHHEGIARGASEYEQKGLEALNIATRRKIMAQQFGEQKIAALERYHGVTSLTRVQAKEILQTVFPDAPEVELTRAVLLCASYSLNPLMGHVFLIPFNKGEENETWATVVGIKAKRLLASRKRPFRYVDDTPRIMTEEEQKRIFGKVKDDKLIVIVKLEDPQTGASGVGYGEWPLKKKKWDKEKREFVEVDNEPYGTDKGNSMFNMATIRGESQALDRLCPGEMPQGVEVIDEGYIDAEHTLLAEPEGGDEIGGPAGQERGGEELGATISSPTKEKPQKIGTLPTQVIQPKRDPETIKTINELYKACHKDWGMQPKDVLKELGVSSQSDISDTPANCYRAISSVRSQ